MKEDNFLQFLHASQQRLVDLTVSKGREYKGAGDDQFGNFHRLANDTGLTREQVLLVYLTKHLDSIRTYVRDEAHGVSRTRSESIGGRIEDAILYLTLLGAMVHEKDNLDKLPVEDNSNQFKGTRPPTFKTLEEILDKKPKFETSSAEFLWSATSVYLAYDPMHVNPDAIRKMVAYLEGESNVKPNATHLTHPDHLHGCAPDTVIVWVGAESSRYKEFDDKCRAKKIVLVPEWLLFSLDVK